MRERVVEDMLGLLEFHAPLLLRCSAVEIWLRDELVVKGPAGEEASGHALERRIPFLLYRDGIRTVEVAANATRADLETLIGALLESAAGRSEDSDLVSRLWEAELTGLRLEIAPLETTLTVQLQPGAGGPATALAGDPGADPFDDWIADAPTTDTVTLWRALEPLEGRASAEWLGRWVADRERPRRERTAEVLRSVHALQDDATMRLALAQMTAGWLAHAIEHGHWDEAQEAYETLPRDEQLREAVEPMLADLLAGLDCEAIAERLDESDPETQGRFFALTVQLGRMALDLTVAVLGLATRARLRAAATTAICYTCSDQPERLERYLDDSRWQVVRNVAFALGQIGGDAIAPLLARASRHPDARVRKQVVQALGQVSPARRLPILIAQLDSSDAALLGATLAMLARTPEPRVVEALLHRVNAVDFESRPPEIRVALLGALGELADDRTVPALEALLHRGGWFARRTPERTAAAETLARIGTPEAIEALRAGTRARAEAVRAASQEALARRERAA
ncbi:MAG: HEAT repeat domain-containing protein [Candidatus Eisenbacteria bacterium]